MSKNLSLIENPFLFQGNTQVRTATGPDGEVWFCAKDIFEVLGIQWAGTSGSLKNIPEKWQVVWYLQTPGGVQSAIFIAEPAVYQTAFRSKKPEAMRFVEWVCDQVLPAIRRQGFFGTLPASNQVGARKVLMETASKLKASRDAFEFALLTQQVRDLCNQLGTPMPDLALLGKDPRQQALPGV